MLLSKSIFSWPKKNPAKTVRQSHRKNRLLVNFSSFFIFRSFIIQGEVFPERWAGGSWSAAPFAALADAPALGWTSTAKYGLGTG